MLQKEEQSAVDKARRAGGLQAVLHNPRVREKTRKQATPKLRVLTGSGAGSDGRDEDGFSEEGEEEEEEVL
ncbi:hypothetical protein KEM54_006418 [Ascosphaera aggregata]|nr:hypothetical protein KEM54_006418 [Ascosphaera aggregata]